ncbi:MAG: hypothetical protein ACE5DP_04375, partial [Fidelibacterota bacterium]
ATVSLNSGTAPGPVRVTATVDVNCDSIDTTIYASDIPAIIVTGPAVEIFPDLEYNDIQPIGAGFYTIPVACIVYDIWHNPVSDSVYVYWTMSVDSTKDSDSLLFADIVGESFTGNTAPDGNSYPGMAWSSIIYASRDIFSAAKISALCFGGDLNGDGIFGDSVYAEVENGAIMPYYPGTLTISTSTSFWDFSLFGNPAIISVTATLLDYYSNPVENGRIQFSAIGATSIVPQVGVTGSDGRATAIVQYDQGICPPIPNTNPLIYEDFTSYVEGLLLDPMSVTSDPVEILLVRTYQGMGR